MLFYHLDWLCNGILGLMLFAWVCAAYAYFVNSRRLASDPQKRDFYLAAVFLAPVTFIPLLLGIILLFIVRALFYCIFLIVSIFALIVIRNAFLLNWLRKTAIYVGDKLLEANTLLIRIFLRPWAGDPGIT